MASTTPSSNFVVTVKTLDGQNKEFSPAKEMTVQAFKALISPEVKVAADLQRLIFRGRVLQDEKTLEDYNLDGNTIHLVQRVAGTPNTNLQPEPRGHGHSHSAGHSHEEGGNAIIMGTIGHLDIPNGPPTPRRNSAAVRLQVANEMINRASTILARLEEEEAVAVEAAAAAARAAEQTAQVAQAGQAAVTAMTNMQTNGPRPTGQGPVAQMTSNNLMSQIANAASAAALVATVSHVPSPPDNNNSTTTTTGGARQGNSTPQAPPEAPRIRELATGLQDILALQERLTPFLRLVLNVLRENRQYSSSEAPQFIYDTVSAAIHAVSHSLHALSDITVDFASAPEARRLRAPASILVEQSTVVRATIPIPMAIGGGMQMQLPANLQNIVSAAANSAMAQGNLGGVDFSEMQALLGNMSSTPTPSPASSGSATPTNTTVNTTSGATDNSGNVSGGNNARPPTPTARFLVPGQQGQGQGGNPSRPRGSPNQVHQLPDFLFGPGGILSNEMGGGRGEMFDILLSCHSHHSGGQSLRTPRPAGLDQHLEDARNSSQNGLSNNYMDFFIETLSSIELFHSTIKDFVTGYLLRGRDPKNESHVNTWAKGVAKRITEWILKSAGTTLHKNPDVDVEATLNNVLTTSLARFVRLVFDSSSPAEFRKSTIRLLEETGHRLLVCTKATFNALHVAAKFLKELFDIIMAGSSLNLRRELTYSLVQYMDVSVADTGDFIKLKVKDQMTETTATLAPEGRPLTPTPPRTTVPRSAPVQIPNAANAQPHTNSVSVNHVNLAGQGLNEGMDVDDDELVRETLPTIPPILRNVPMSWLDQIRSDMNAQHHAPSQPQFSHGFRSLFPPK